ncbi:uncharacterized protein LOC126966393 [Leptidea sinapis]|uniref:uncharacterized protein LOC126966393 n=1 Tax=Leptidea sinapis TaxID=189913 RepID=UPI00212375CE|nr:uncharacterized protein LOC126966393 [Leptidea sinapis]XP_050666350.1 uncharacterized protein LOC126966393 [Leptidea sinapis]
MSSDIKEHVNYVLDETCSDWKNLYSSKLWSNSELRKEILSTPFVENKAIKYCYTCRGKIRNYEIKSPNNNFIPHYHSTPKGNVLFEEVQDKKAVCRNAWQKTVNLNGSYIENINSEDKDIPSVSKQVDENIRESFRSETYYSTNREGRRLRKSLKGIGCIVNFALSESPKKQRTQIKACSISVMILAIVIISLILVNISTPTLLHSVNNTSTTVVPIINTETDDNSTIDLSTYSDLPYSITTEISEISTTESLFTTTVHSVRNNFIEKIRKNIKTFKIKTNHSETSKETINRDLFQKFCSCQKDEVCMLDEDNGRAKCRVAADVEDPTGCGGLCELETEACQLVDRLRGVRVCRLITMATCSPSDWRCRNGLCVPFSSRCDGSVQCYDRSDEMHCDCDLTKQFRCGHSLSCFPNEKLCDGVIDCWDGLDETNCTTTDCPKDQFPCNDGQCIASSRFCDGYADCSDGSDEPQGCDSACSTHELRCGNQRCVPLASHCDGHDDCGDNTDEQHCS